MKSAILLLLGGACLCAQQQGSLEGTAIQSATREPLSNVHVRLVNASFAGISGAYGAMSDRAGHFSIATIRPGTYILLPERSGFLHVQGKGATVIPTITIKAGEHLTGYELEMAPRAVLTGRVVDEAGDPVQGVHVQTVAVTPDSAAVVLNPAPNPATDDRGEFRILGPAGKFYLQATPNSSGDNERPEVRSDGTREITYATTFYPSSLRKDKANVVEAVAGKDVGGLEIRLARQQQGGLAISGTVSGIPPGTARPYVAMQWGDKAPAVTSSRSVPVAADGKFTFDALQPGFYRLFAGYNEGKTILASRMMEWTLDNNGVANVDLMLVPGLEVSGKVRMEGDPPGTPTVKRTVKLDPALGYNVTNQSRSGGELDADGLFRITGVSPGKYRVRVDPLPDAAYVKAVEIDGQPSSDNSVDLSNALKGVNANILIGRNGVLVSGRVLSSTGEPMQANVVMIYLIKEFAEILTLGNGTTQATPDGKYTLKSFAPGKYKLFAIDAFQIAGTSAIDILKDMFERAVEVEFHEGDKITKDLKVMPKEDPNAKKK